MKRILFVCLLFATMVSCSSGPSKAAQEFTENMAKGKYAEAKKYATPSTGMLLDMAANMAATMGEQETNPDFKFHLVKDSVDGNNAWVTFFDKSVGEETEQTLELVKIDGKWKVDMGMQK